MNILSYDEIFRAFLLGSMAGVAICIGYFLAIYQKNRVLDTLRGAAEDIREALRVCRKVCGRDREDADDTGSD